MPVLQTKPLYCLEAEIPPVWHDQHDLANLSTCYCQQTCRQIHEL